MKSADPSQGISPAAVQERPEGVPESACFNANQSTWVVGELDAYGRKQGLFTSFDQRGVLVSELHYHDDQLEGPFRRFHPNGELAREGSFAAGALDGVVVSYSSSAASPERLRACCVPSAARSLRTRYRAGRRVSEDFYDEHGRRLLDDGSLYPTRPPSVSELARFVPHDSRWEQGSYDAQAHRHGEWTFWTLEGHPMEDVVYLHGKRHGPHRKYVEGAAGRGDEQLAWACDFVMGTPAGRYVERVPPSTYRDERVTTQSGQMTAGRRSGVWEFRDAASEVVRQVDYGSACSEEQIVAAILEGRVPAGELPPALTLHTLVSGAGRAGARVAEGLTAWLDAHSVPLSTAASERLIASIRAEKLSWEERLVRFAHAIFEGADPARSLREIANLAIGHPLRGLDYAELAVELSGGAAEALVTRALLRLEVGEVEGAEQDIAALTALAPSAARQVQLQRDCIYPRFEFWPAEVEVDEHASPELPSELAQPLEAVQATVAKAARRLTILRAELVRRLGAEPAWLPPSLPFAAAEEALEQYGFDVVDDQGTDTVVVDERLQVADAGLAQLMRQSRIEWTALCWLCWSAGQSEVAWPDQLEPPGAFARAVVTAFRRHWLAQDRLQTNGLRARAQRAGTFLWQGRRVEELGRLHAEWALAEQLAMRATLYYLADPSCRSLWQDDLRG